MAGDEAQVGEAYGDRLGAAFDELLAVAPADRWAFVDSRFASDPDLQRDLRGMLRHVGTDTSFIEPPAPEEVQDLLAWTSTDPDPAAPRLRGLAGTVVADRYGLTRLVGSGGAGVVYEAEDRLRGTKVAVKILRNDTGDGRLEKRWEATTLRLLRLPGVVELIDEGESDGLAYLVTALVDGAPFPGRLPSGGWIGIRDTVLALLETLERMHGAGIVHRDLKPGNVLVDVRGRPHVLDLGIAQPREAATGQTARSSRRGTLGYMAPEQLRGEPATVRSDLYAVGVMLHEALAGERFRSEPSVRLARFGLISEREKPLEELQEGVPEGVQRVVSSLLERDPDDRPASARDVLDTLLDDDATRRERRRLPWADRERPFEEAELRALFAGPDRLLHLKEDGARELWARTSGHPHAVARELDAWSRAGLGWWHGPHYHVRRRDLDTLARGLRTPPPTTAAELMISTLDDTARDVALVVDLAGPRATPELVGQVLDLDLGAVEATVVVLEGAGWIRRVRGNALEALVTPQDATERRNGRREGLHRRIALALEPGDERRLFHWVAAGTMEPVPAESIAVASSLLEDGRLDAARAIVREGLRALTLRPDAGWQMELLELDLYAAVRGGTIQALDEVLQDLGTIPPTPRTRRLERIAQCAQRALGGEHQRALDEAPAPEATSSEMEIRTILSVRSFAGRALGSHALRAVLEEAESQVGDSPGLQAALQMDRGWLAYGEHRFADAAAAHLAAAEMLPNEVARNGCRVNAASALMEVGELDRVEELATKSIRFARERRIVPLELRATWLARSAAYRRGDALAPDVALAIAGTAVGMPQAAGPLLINEAAIAWRAGRRRTAERLARGAVQTLAGPQHTVSRLLARALAVACASPPDEDEAAAVLAACRAMKSPRVAIQVAGLLARAPTRVQGEAAALAAARWPEIPPSERHLRRELLSAAEALNAPPTNP